MKKLLYLFVFTAFGFNTLAQTYKAERMNGIKVRNLTYTFTDSTVVVSQRKLTDLYSSRLVVTSDDKGQVVKDYFTNVKGMKTRFRLIELASLKNPTLQVDMVDSFTDKVITVLVTLKKVIIN